MVHEAQHHHNHVSPNNALDLLWGKRHAHKHHTIISKQPPSSPSWEMVVSLCPTTYHIAYGGHTKASAFTITPIP